MSGCGGDTPRPPLPTMRLRVEFAGDEAPWEYPLALNGRRAEAVYVDGARYDMRAEDDERRIAELESLVRDMYDALITNHGGYVTMFTLERFWDRMAALGIDVEGGA